MPISSLNSTNKNPLSGFINATGGGTSTYTLSGTTYKVHTFNTSGNFIINSGYGTVDYLIIAGGGAGGGVSATTPAGGGGGAGGVIQGSVNLNAGTYSIVIGSGGSKSTTTPSNGSDSIFNNLTAIGGGRGGSWGGVGQLPGGSSGGQAYTHTLASPVPGQGYSGGYAAGTGNGSEPYTAGGGGGAGGPGGNAGASGGNGGNGITTTITGTSVNYAAGGSGGGTSRSGGNNTAGTVMQNSGAGIGGNSSVLSGSDASSNSGSGGGGVGGHPSAQTANGGNGGSGIVILKYRIA